MNLSVLDIADDPAPWLDQQVVGPDLDAIVAALDVVHAKRQLDPPPSLDDVLGEHASEVLQRGLASLPLGSLRRLMHHPRVLLDLQERVLVEGSSYWQGLLDKNEALDEPSRATWPAIAALLDASGVVVSPATPALDAATPAVRPPRVALIRTWAKMATIAASMLGFLYATTPFPSSAEPGRTKIMKVGRMPWGWNARDFDTVEPDPSYLNHLADDAEQWPNARPDEPVAFALRLGELRTGCSRLIVAPHDSLDQEDRTWLVEACRKWAAELDAAIGRLENKAAVAEVRADVDMLVQRLADDLRARTLRPKSADGGSNTR